MRDQPALVGVGPHRCRQRSMPSDLSRWEADQIAVVIAETHRGGNGPAPRPCEVEWEDLPRRRRHRRSARRRCAAAASRARARHQRLPPPQASARATSMPASPQLTPSIDATYEVPAPGARLPAARGRRPPGPRRRGAGHRSRSVASGPHEDREQVAHVLGLPDDRVRIHLQGDRRRVRRQARTCRLQIALGPRGDATRPNEGDPSARSTAAGRVRSPIVGHHKRHRGRIHAAARRHPRRRHHRPRSRRRPRRRCAYNYTSNKVLGNAHLSASPGRTGCQMSTDRQSWRSTRPPCRVVRSEVSAGRRVAFVDRDGR